MHIQPEWDGYDLVPMSAYGGEALVLSVEVVGRSKETMSVCILCCLHDLKSYLKIATDSLDSHVAGASQGQCSLSTQEPALDVQTSKTMLFRKTTRNQCYCYSPAEFAGLHAHFNLTCF